MTPEQLEQFRQKLAVEKFTPGRSSQEYEFQRGWNAAIEFAEANLALILKPKEENRGLDR